MGKGPVVLAALIMALGLGAPAMAIDADAILGLWATEKGTESGYAHVDVVKENGKYRGTIIWLEKPNYPPDDEGGMAGQPKVDRENPDPKQQKRPIIGLEMMGGFTYAGDGLWHKGKIYDPDNGKTYKCKVRLTDEGVLKVRGFIGFSLLGRTTEWTRVPRDVTEE